MSQRLASIALPADLVIGTNHSVASMPSSFVHRFTHTVPYFGGTLRVGLPATATGERRLDSPGGLARRPPVLPAFAELAVVIGDLVLVALRHFFAAGTAHAARAVGVFHLAAEFHFDLLDAAHQGGLYARGQQRIVGVGVGIEALHVADQAFEILDHGGIVALRLLLQLTEGLERLVVVVLEVLGTDGAVARLAVGVPGTAVRVAVTGAAAIATAGVGGTAARLLHLPALLAAALLALATLLSLLSRLTLLSLLSLLTLLLSLLTLLTLLAALEGSLPALTVLVALALPAVLRAQLLQLLAEALHLSQRGLGKLIVLAALAVLGARAHGLLDVLQMLLELVDALRDGGFRHDGVAAHAAADPIGIALHIALDLGLLQFAEGLAHLGGGFALGVLQVADGRLHTLLQAFKVLDLAILFAAQLTSLLARQPRTILAERLAHLAFEGLLAVRQLFGLAGQVFHLAGGLLVSHAGEHLLGFLQTLRGAPRLRLALRRSRLL